MQQLETELTEQILLAHLQPRGLRRRPIASLDAVPPGSCFYLSHPNWQLRGLGALMQLRHNALKELDLRNNQLAEVGADLSRFETLVDLRLDGNQITEIELHFLPRLQLLSLAFNELQVLPELMATIGCEQSPKYHPEGDVYQHIRLMLDQMDANAPAELPWTILLHDIAKPDTYSVGEDGLIHNYGHDKLGAEMSEGILERLRFPRQQIDDIVFTVRQHMNLAVAPKMRKAKLRRLLMRPTFPLELEQHRIDCLGSHRKLEIYDFLCAERDALAAQPALAEPLLRGADLIELGVAPGPRLGQLLNELHDRQLAEEITTREAALVWAKENAAKSGSTD